MDAITSLQELKNKIQTFCEARDWDQFHGAKDLAIGLITEASELLEHFRFKTENQIEAALADPEKRRQVAHELADSLFFLIRFSQKYGFDLSDSLHEKMELNNKRYPVELIKGRNAKYTELSK